MILKLEENSRREEIEVLIKYAKMNHSVQQVISAVKSCEITLNCNAEGKQFWIKISDIYYIESIDKKTYIYSKEKVYCSEERLYQLKEELAKYSFVQISKSCILNINMLENIRSLLNSRMEAALSNGEKINISRKYIPAIKEKLAERWN